MKTKKQIESRIKELKLSIKILSDSQPTLSSFKKIADLIRLELIFLQTELNSLEWVLNIYPYPF